MVGTAAPVGCMQMGLLAQAMCLTTGAAGFVPYMLPYMLHN